MKEIEGIKYYSPKEEKINIISHATGFILSIVALVLLVAHANMHGNVWHVVSFSIFGTSLIILYAASTFYHSAKKPELRKKMRIIDHASIYVLIAGTYTPFTLVTLKWYNRFGDSIYCLGIGFNRNNFETFFYRKI